MALAGTLELQITAGLARLQQDMDRAKQITSAGADVMKKALAGIGVGISVAGFAGLIKSVIDAGDKLHELSKISGLTVEQLGGLNKIAKLNGTTLDQVSKAVGLMSKNMYAGADAFKTLGIQTRESDGSMRSANAVLLDVADRFSRMNNSVERSALSMKIFGKSGRELIPMLSEGRAAIEAATESYSKNSAMTTRAAAESDRFGDQLVVLGERTTAIKTRFVVELLPSINDIISAFLRATDGASKFAGAGNLLAPILRGLAIAGYTVIDTFNGVGRSIGAAIAQAVALSKFDYSQYLAIGDELNRMNIESRKTYDDFVKTVLNGENVIDENNKELKEMLVLQEQIGDATGKSTGKTKAYNVEVYKLKELEKQLAGAKDIEYQKLKRHESALNEAKQLTEQTRTAQEKYNAAIQRYNSLKPYLTADTYARAVANATNELEISRSELDKVDEANKNLRDNWRHAWTNMEQTGRMAFTQFAAHGVSSIESIGNALKLAVFDLLYHLTARRWIINIGTSLESTMLGAAGASAATAGGGGALSAANLGVGALNLAKGGFGAMPLLGSVGGMLPGTAGAFFSGMGGGTVAGVSSSAALAGSTFASVAGPAIALFAVDQIGRMLAGDKTLKGFDKIPVIGGFLAAMFGRGPLKQKETTLSGVIGTEGFESGMLNARFKAQGGWFRSDKTDFARVDAITGEIWTDNQKQLGEFAKSLSKASKGIFSAFNDAAKESSKIINSTADNLGLSTEAMKDFEYQLKLVSEKGKNLTQEQIAEEIGKMSDAMAEKFIPNIQELTKTSESAIEAISRLNAEFTATEQAARVLGMSLADAKVYVQGMGFELRTAFTDAAGGVESFASKIAFVGDNFLTEEQRFAMGIETLNSQLTKASVPLDATKESFYQLLRVTAAAGDAIKFGGLLDIAPLFAQIRDAQEMARLAAEEQKTLALQTADAAVKQLIKEREDKRIASIDQEMDLSYAALQRSIDAEKLRITNDYNAAIKESELRIKGVVDSISNLTDISKLLKSSVASMSGFDIVAARAQVSAAIASQDFSSPALRDAITALTQKGAGFTSKIEEQRYNAQNLSLLRSLDNVADSDLLLQERSLAALQSAEKILKQNYDAEIIRLDGIMTAAKVQIDVLNKIDTSVLSVGAAMERFASAMLAANAVVPQQQFRNSDVVSISPSVAAALVYDSPLRMAAGLISPSVAAAALYDSPRPIARFDVGGRVPKTGIAMIHKDEQVLSVGDKENIAKQLQAMAETMEVLTVSMNKMKRVLEKWDGAGMPDTRAA